MKVDQRTTPFFWIDGFNEYDQAIIKKNISTFKKILEPIAAEYGLTIKYINIAELFFGFCEQSLHIYYRGRDILKHKGYAYIPYANPHPQTEHLLQALVRIINMSSNWIHINMSQYLDRDKEQAFYLASLIGARTIPSWLVPHRTTSRTQVDLIEKQLGPYPYIIKPTSFLAGIGVMKVDSRDDLCSLLDYCAQSMRIYLIQPFIKDAVDYRVYLENHEVIACQKRSPPKEGYLSNISQRGSGEAVQASAQIVAYSKTLSHKLSDGYLCIDWLVAKDDQVYLSEIDFFGLCFGLPETTRNQVLRAFFRSVINKARS